MALYLYPQSGNKNSYNFDINELIDIHDNSNTSYAKLTSKVSVVIKKINKPRTDRADEWSHIYNHPNIVEFLGIYSIKDEDESFLIMPFANDGNLRKYIKNNSLSFNRKIEIAINITDGIKFLHENNIVHEYLIPNNILIFDGIAKISNLPNDLYIRNKDLYINDNLFDNIGYIDPNLILSRNYEKNKSIDIYSLGTLLWEIMSEKIPYSKDQDDSVLKLIIKIKGGYREVDIIDNLEYNNLYKNCWNGNNLNRPTINDVYNRLLRIKN